mgnify:CR=1 FL=1
MSHEHKYGPIVNNWSLSSQEYAAAMGAAPAAKWYVDLCHRVEREQYEAQCIAQLRGYSSSPDTCAPLTWTGVRQYAPQPNLRHNPLPPDLDARELELARGLSGVEIDDAVNTLAGAFGLAAEHAREMMDAITRTRASQIPAGLLFQSPMPSLGHTVVPEASAWSVEYQAVPTDPWNMPHPAAAEICNWWESDAEYRARARATFMHSRRNDVAAHVGQTIAAQFAAVEALSSERLGDIADVTVTEKL